MKLTADYWIKYINTHTSANKAAERRMERYIAVNGTEDMDKLADYAYALVSKYGEAASALSCEMYDQMARAQNANVPEAVPAETASYGEVSKAVRGAGKTSPTLISDAVGRLVKQAGADTTLQNAARDGAYFAWIAHGDTCPYCMALAAIGWQKAGKLTLKGGHAEHIHANCDCEYAIDHTGDLEIEDYDPYEINQQLLDMTDGEFDAEDLLRMSGHNGKGHDHSALNIIRRKHYAANKDYINAQKRAAYARRNTHAIKMKTETTWEGKPKKNAENELLELKQFALEKGVVLDPIFMSFDGDIDLVKDFIETMNDNLSNRSFLRKKKIKLGVSYTMLDDTYAETAGSKVTINGFAYRDRSLLEKAYALKVKDGWFPEGSTYLDIATHESAHVIVYMDQLKTKDVTVIIFGKDGIKASEEILNHISEYALTNNNELIAESYVRYKNGSKDEYVLKVLEYTGIIK